MQISREHTDAVVLVELGARLRRHRLRLNMTQAELAREAGVSKSTVERLEAGSSTQLSSFVRLLRALDLLENLNLLAREPAPSPMEELRFRGKQRQRASTRAEGRGPPGGWAWADET